MFPVPSAVSQFPADAFRSVQKGGDDGSFGFLHVGMPEGGKRNADARGYLSRGKEDRGSKAGQSRVGFLQIRAKRSDRILSSSASSMVSDFTVRSVYGAKEVPEKSCFTVSADRNARIAFPRAEQ